MRKFAQWIEDGGSNITSQLTIKTTNLEWFFLFLYKSMDITDTTQTMLFIQRVTAEIEVTEELNLINYLQVRIFSVNLRKLFQYNLR